VGAHAVTLAECSEVIANRPYLNEPGDDDSRLMFGKTDGGRMLLVVAVADTVDPLVAFIVTARDMTDKERKRFRKRVQTKGTMT